MTYNVFGGTLNPTLRSYLVQWWLFSVRQMTRAMVPVVTLAVTALLVTHVLASPAAHH